ncbi:MAG: hypothetical protein R3F05_10170 [Planctomycetota bacterium]
MRTDAQGGLVEGGRLAADDAFVGGERQIGAACHDVLQDLAFEHLADDVRQVARRERVLEPRRRPVRLAEQDVAYEHRGCLAEAGVERGATASDGRAVDDVVMHERRRVDQLHDGRDRGDVSFDTSTGQPGAQAREGGTQALARERPRLRQERGGFRDRSARIRRHASPTTAKSACSGAKTSGSGTVAGPGADISAGF